MTTIVPQCIDAKLTRAAIFLEITLKPGEEATNEIRALCGDLSSLERAVGFRDPDSTLSCIMGFGSDAWDRLFGSQSRPSELHPFKEIKGAHHAVSTQCDILLHVRSTRLDQCFEFVNIVMERIGDYVETSDEVHGFKYYDERDLLGFVDGTENPSGQLAVDSTLIKDGDFEGGSYVITQKYSHNLKSWNALSTEQQELIIGRRKLSDVELSDKVKPSNAHNALTIIEENGVEVKILRDNMPFGNVSKGEFGTYFIGYCSTAARTEKMLTNMFIGNPPGNYDRILDFSTAVSGSLYFCPSQTFLDNID